MKRREVDIMALTTNVARFHKEIFPKVRYDYMLEQYRINIGDYILLNLTKRQFGVLERICLKNDIYLEKVPEMLSVEESEVLFKKLLTLKKQFENSNDSDRKEELEKEIYCIRSKIFEGHLKLLYIVLYKNIPNLEESSYKEDILQSACIFLLNHIDIYNPLVSNCSFRQFFWNYTANKIVKKAVCIYNNSVNNDFNAMLRVKNKLEKNDEFSVEKLSKETGLEEERIEELTVLEKILNAESLDEKIIIPVDGCQEEVYQRILKELLILMVETLPNELQKEIIMKYYGLDGKIPQSFDQIATDLGVNHRQRVQQISADAHKNLQSSIRAKYIKELVEGYSLISLGDELEMLPIDEQSLDYEKLESYLLLQLPSEELLELINSLDIKYRDILISYFEINGYYNMTNEEKSQKLGISHRKYLELKRRGLYSLRVLIKHRYLLDFQNENINTVLDYLMYNYLHKYKKKIREK